MSLFDLIGKSGKGKKKVQNKELECTATSKEILYADSSTIEEDEKPYYQQDDYYTFVTHADTVFQKEVIPFEDRKKTTYPSARGLYVPEILLLEYCSYGKYPKPTNGYPGFWWFEYGIRDIGGLLQSLQERGFIEFGAKKASLEKLSVDSLKEILSKCKLPTNGKKAVLVERIRENVTEENLPDMVELKKYTLTEKGQKELSDNAYVPYMHKHRHKTTEDATFGNPFNVWEMNKIIAPDGRQSEWKSIIGKIEKERFGVNMAELQGTSETHAEEKGLPNDNFSKREEMRTFIENNRANIVQAASKGGDGFTEESKGLDYYSLGKDKEALYYFYISIEKNFDAPALYKETATLLHKYGLYDEERDVLKRGLLHVSDENRHRNELEKMLQTVNAIESKEVSEK